MGSHKSRATYNSLPVAMAQVELFPGQGQGQDKTGGPVRALDTSMGNSNHRVIIQVVKEQGGLKRGAEKDFSI